jgi:glutaredoxin-related protein
MKDFKNLKKIVNLEDHYKVFDKIGEGGFAQVFKA